MVMICFEISLARRRCCRVSFVTSYLFNIFLKSIFHLATLFARREAKARIRQREWLKLAGEKIRRENVENRLKVGNAATKLLPFNSNTFTNLQIFQKPTMIRKNKL